MIDRENICMKAVAVFVYTVWHDHANYGRMNRNLWLLVVLLISLSASSPGIISVELHQSRHLLLLSPLLILLLVMLLRHLPLRHC